MITQERLKELIKQEATIYYLDVEWNISTISLSKNDFIKTERVGDALVINTKCGPTPFQILKQLFETEEDAEEYLKYGNITKTEELVMADWNDVKNTTYGFCGSFNDGTIFYTLSIKDGYVYVDMLDYYYLEHTVNCLFKKEFNRENYNEARDLFVKLFKGEKI